MPQIHNVIISDGSAFRSISRESALSSLDKGSLIHPLLNFHQQAVYKVLLSTFTTRNTTLMKAVHRISNLLVALVLIEASPSGVVDDCVGIGSFPHV